jgi:GMP synthase-like glutamine amidotransferase
MGIKQICVIETGHSPESLVDQYGSYPDMGIQLAKRCLSNMKYTTVSAVDGDTLPPAEEFDGYVIMGSEFSALDAFPWIQDLTKLIKSAAAKNIPLMGICFGHQIMAQALGGRVEQTQWNVGQVCYNTSGESYHTIAYHQDQVTVAPIDASIVMTSVACPIAALRYSSFPGFSIQAHPEFSDNYMLELIEHTRHNPLSDEQTTTALKSMEGFERKNAPVYSAMRDIFQREAHNAGTESGPTRR